MTFFLFGAGYCARALAKQQKAQSFGTTRQHAQFDALKEANICPLLFDGQSPSHDMIEALERSSAVVFSIPPSKSHSAGIDLKKLAPHLGHIKWLGYLSTIGVYGNHNGAIVDEETKPAPSHERHERRLNAEAEFAALGQHLSLPVAILRLGGIYGPKRNVFIKLAEQSARRIIKPHQVFNRIHVDDIGAAISHLCQNHHSGLFNLVDDLPSPPQDVITYGAQLMGCAPPPAIAFDEGALSPMLASFYQDNKRVSNKKLKQSGYVLKYRDYKQGLQHMWQQNSWNL